MIANLILDKFHFPNSARVSTSLQKLIIQKPGSKFPSNLQTLFPTRLKKLLQNPKNPCHPFLLVISSSNFPPTTPVDASVLVLTERSNNLTSLPALPQGPAGPQTFSRITLTSTRITTSSRLASGPV